MRLGVTRWGFWTGSFRDLLSRFSRFNPSVLILRVSTSAAALLIAYRVWAQQRCRSLLLGRGIQKGSPLIPVTEWIQVALATPFSFQRSKMPQDDLGSRKVQSYPSGLTEVLHTDCTPNLGIPGILGLSLNPNS